MLALLAAVALAGAPLAAPAPAPDSLVVRGEAIPASAQALPLGTVLADPARYATQPVLIEGVVVKNCTEKGCWMQVAGAAGQPGIRVTFKDYGFFIPLNSAGMKVRAQGVLETKRHSRRDAKHLAEEGAGIVLNADGTATEVTFVASGVELRR